jgi:hypothetical protein
MSLQSSTAQMPQDTDGKAIPVLSPTSSANVMTAAAASARVAVPSGCLVVEIVNLVAVHFKFGDSSVTAAATDRILPAGAVISYYIPQQVVGGPRSTHIAFMKVSGEADGLVSIGALN